MFAIVKTGGKQYRVAKDDVIVVEKLPGEAGAAVTLDQVLMIGDGDKQQVGKPRIVGAAVAATIVAQKKGEKVLIFKKRRRQNYRRKRGHRQELTVLKVTDIRAAG